MFANNSQTTSWCPRRGLLVQVSVNSPGYLQACGFPTPNTRRLPLLTTSSPPSTASALILCLDCDLARRVSLSCVAPPTLLSRSCHCPSLPSSLSCLQSRSFCLPPPATTTMKVPFCSYSFFLHVSPTFYQFRPIGPRGTGGVAERRDVIRCCSHSSQQNRTKAWTGLTLRVFRADLRGTFPVFGFSARPWRVDTAGDNSFDCFVRVQFPFPIIEDLVFLP